MLDVAKIEAEIGKLIAESSKLNAETAKLSAEARKLGADRFWYPVAVAAGVMTAGAALAKVFLA